MVEATAVEALQSQRYLPPTTIRVVMDERGKDHSNLSHRAISQAAIEVDNNTAVQVVRAKQKALKLLVDACEQQAQQQAPVIVQEAHANAEATLMREIDRLKALQQVNPNVRDDEIVFYEDELGKLTRLIDATQLRLDALRVVVVT